MRQYEHMELNEKGAASIEKVPYQGKEVLLRHFYGNEKIGPFVVVVGFIQGDYMRPRDGTSMPITNVEPVTDANQKTELTDLLKQRGEQKPIDFWW